MEASDSTRSVIREILRDNAGLSGDVAELADDADLFGAGMNSHATVTVMVALEEAFDVMFPDTMLERSVFGSIDAIALAIDSLRSETTA